jgi:hypothetical protein
VSGAIALPFALAPALVLGAPPPPQLRPVGGPTPPPRPASPPAPPAPAPTTTPAAERWLQNHSATALWSDPAGGRALAQLAQWSHLRLTGSQVGLRLPVVDVRSGAKGWVDALAVGPSGPPASPVAPPSTAPTAAPFPAFWVAPFAPAALLAEPRPDAAPLATLELFAPLQVTGPAADGFYPVTEPYSRGRGWVDADALGPVGEPRAAAATRWWGKVVVDGAVLRSAPRRAAPQLAALPRDAVVGFEAWAAGEEVTWDDPAWGQVAPGVFLYGRLTRPVPAESPPAPRVESPPSGEWIGINRTAQLVVAYRDAEPRFWARTSTGRPGWETPLGAFTVLRRVASETMDSSTLLGKDAERADYRIERVRWTQYFTADGNALHENWWKEPDTFGLPTSHGCAGLLPEDARRLWDFAAVGMPVLVHP